MLKLLAFITLSLIASVVQSSHVNDVLCDRQLNYFDEALNDRRDWAIFGKKLKKTILLKSKISLQSSTRGQSSSRAFSVEIW